jgi:hypothetical protein
LSAILQALTRYSANNPQFPVNDRSLFAGKSHGVDAFVFPDRREAIALRSPASRCRNGSLGGFDRDSEE